MFFGTRVTPLVWICLVAAGLGMLAGVVGIQRVEARAGTQSEWRVAASSSDTVELHMDDGRVLRIPRESVPGLGNTPSDHPLLDTQFYPNGKTPFPMGVPRPGGMPDPMSMPSPSVPTNNFEVSKFLRFLPVAFFILFLAIVIQAVKGRLRASGASFAPTEVHQDAERNGSYTTGVGAIPGSPTTESKLRELDRLHAEGLLTPEEYQIHRQRILNSF